MREWISLPGKGCFSKPDPEAGMHSMIILSEAARGRMKSFDIGAISGGMTTICADTFLRGIRGATTAERNDCDAICSATRELLLEMVNRNKLETTAMAAVLFSASNDLNSAFPARAARELGWLQVPLFCSAEIDVHGSLSRCIRVLILINTELAQNQIEHVYLREAIDLRNDGAEKMGYAGFPPGSENK